MNDTQPAAQAVAPVLVRDVAEVLGVSVAHINSALIVAGCAPRSTNMEISGEELLAVAAAVKAAAPVAPPAVQPLTPQQIADAVEGMTVSVDVSTCDADEQHRVFGRITEAMEDPEGKHGLVLLVQDAVELNFDRLAASPLSQDQCDSLISEHWNGVGPVSRDVYTAFIRAVERAHKIGGA